MRKTASQIADEVLTKTALSTDFIIRAARGAADKNRPILERFLFHASPEDVKNVLQTRAPRALAVLRKGGRLTSPSSGPLVSSLAKVVGESNPLASGAIRRAQVFGGVPVGV